MKKVDILNFITDFRKSPNQVKSYADILAHVAKGDESTLQQLISELQQTKVVKETDLNGQRAYQVVSR